jgi:hypothetical protein
MKIAVERVKRILRITQADWQAAGKRMGQRAQPAQTKVAALPEGREAGQVKRSIRHILSRNNWPSPSIHESRNGSGFQVHAWRPMEQLPDIGPEGGRENRHAQAEFDQEAQSLQDQLRHVKPPPQNVVVSIRIHRDQTENQAKLYAYLKYEEGFYVTPIEFL